MYPGFLNLELILVHLHIPFAHSYSISIYKGGESNE